MSQNIKLCLILMVMNSMVVTYGRELFYIPDKFNINFMGEKDVQYSCITQSKKGNFIITQTINVNTSRTLEYKYLRNIYNNNVDFPNTDFVCINEANIMKTSGTTGISNVKLTYNFDPPIDLTSYLGIIIKLINDMGTKTYFNMTLYDNNTRQDSIMYALEYFNGTFGYDLVYYFTYFKVNIHAVKSMSFELTPPLAGNDYYYKFDTINCNDCQFSSVVSIPNNNNIHYTFDNNIYTYYEVSLLNMTNVLYYSYDNTIRLNNIKLIWYQYVPKKYTLQLINSKNRTINLRRNKKTTVDNFITVEYNLSEKQKKQEIRQIIITINPDTKNIPYKLSEFKTF